MGKSYKILSHGKCVLCGNDIAGVDNIFLCKDCDKKQKAMSMEYGDVLSGDKKIDAMVNTISEYEYLQRYLMEQERERKGS